MTSPEPGASLPFFPIQLVEVFCISAHADRRQRTSEDVAANTVLLSYSELDQEGLSFSARIEVHSVAPVLEDEVADLALTVHGNFRASSGRIDPELHRRFVEHTPLVQLWPYARGYLAGMGAMLGVALPPLPLIHALSPTDGLNEPQDEDAARPG